MWIGVLVHEASAVLVILNGARMAGSDGMLTLLRNIFIDLVVEADLKPYDFCALAPVVNGAGGSITDWRGQALTLESDGRSVASGDPALHGQVIETLDFGGG